VSLFDELEQCIALMKRATTIAGLSSTLEEMTRLLGFDYFGLAHHTDLAARHGDAVALGNYPLPWVAQMVERRLYVDDPVHVASQVTPRSFRWSEIPDLIAVTHKHRAQLDAARNAGLAEGLTIPINMPGHLPASCSFVSRSGRAFPSASMHHAHYAGCFAFEAAKRLGRPAICHVAAGQLTTRQLDCLVLVAKGKSDAVAGQLLGISRETVHEYVETTKRRFGVATRQQLIARALYDGHLTYADIL